MSGESSGFGILGARNSSGNEGCEKTQRLCYQPYSQSRMAEDDHKACIGHQISVRLYHTASKDEGYLYKTFCASMNKLAYACAQIKEGGWDPDPSERRRRSPCASARPRCRRTMKERSSRTERKMPRNKYT